MIRIDPDIWEQVKQESQAQFDSAKQEIADEKAAAEAATADIRAGAEIKQQAQEALQQAKQEAITAAEDMAQSLGTALIDLSEDFITELLLPLMGEAEMMASLTLSITNSTERIGKSETKKVKQTEVKEKFEYLYAVYLQQMRDYEKAKESGKKYVRKPDDLDYKNQMEILNTNLAKVDETISKATEDIQKATEELDNLHQNLIDKLKQSDMFLEAKNAAANVKEVSKSLNEATTQLVADVATVATKYMVPLTMAGPYPTLFNPAIAFQDAKKLKMSGEDLNTKIQDIMSSLAKLGVSSDTYSPLDAIASSVGVITQLPLP